ncbi:MAG: beta-ketoacyl-ACP synthase II [Candidatus Gastranaerophilales bacterium]|nr:beta-ketoacyl-ACP synthase II [Candidatus Gastranaerophilales bacterium]
MKNNSRRVVVTGMGAISPYGIGTDLLWEGLSTGKNGIRTISTLENIEKYPVRIAGEVPNFNPEEYLDKKEAKRMDRFSQYAVIAAGEAYKDAGLDVAEIDHERLGVIVGSAAGGMTTIENNVASILAKGPAKCSPFTVPMMIVDMAAGLISIKYNAKGVNKAVVSACATAAHSIGDAFRAIQYGDADVVISGGSEAAVAQLGMSGFTSARTLSSRNDDPEHASRPFDKDRDGFVMAEGAGILILEELEHAKARGAKIYAEIVGYGATADANDMVAPCCDGDGAGRAMAVALKDAQMEPSEVTYINAHGTSTGLGDIAESLAIERVFGEHAYNGLLVSSTKSMIGHSLGASGGLEAIASIKAIDTGIVPPTINFVERDEKIPALDFVPNKPRVLDEVKVAMSNSFGFGGHNASLIFKKYEA